MKLLCVVVLLTLVISKDLSAQTRYLVKFRDKGTNTHSLANPATFLSQRSIDRRTRYSISLDSTDLPVTARYVDSLRKVPNVIVLNVSKWLNQVSIQTSDNSAIAKINSYPFVISTSPLAARTATTRIQKNIEVSEPAPFTARTPQAAADFYNYGQSYTQVHMHNGEFLHNLGLRGQNMQISMFDGGFFSYQTLPSFDSARKNGQILDTWDFVAREPGVNEDHPHGMQCLSTIAANLPGQFVGTAPKASFYLYRSEEVATEYPIEEHNWVCAAERADSSGADVISSSVGYMTFDDPAFSHSYADMNGNTTMPAIAGDLAAKKGLIVVNSAGNEGNDPWHYIITPADGDSVVAVGAVNASRVVAGFSSYGPSSDNQVKPDLASMGVQTVVQATNGTISINSGTSFSAPNLAGLITCLWQGFPEMNNMKIIEALKLAGDKASAPDNRTGYGIPDMQKAVLHLLKNYSTASAAFAGCKSTISWTSKDMSGMQYEIERKAPGETEFRKLGEIPATGNSFSRQSYTYEDILVNIEPGNVDYRIRQIIDAPNGIGDYIDSFTITVAVPCKAIQVNPNPVRGSEAILRILTQDAIPDLRINVFNAAGYLLTQYKLAKPAGLYNMPLPVHSLPAGAYFVVMYHNGKKAAGTSFVKL